MTKVAVYLRYVCGMFFTYIPQLNLLSFNWIYRLRYIAVCFPYPCVRREKYVDEINVYIGIGGQNIPQHTAKFENSFLNELTAVLYGCGISAEFGPKHTANIPQTYRNFSPQLWRAANA